MPITSPAVPPVDLTAIRASARAARRARADAEASADRLADEPPQPPLTTRLAYGLTGIGRRLAHASLTLEAALENPARARDQPPPAQQARRAKVVDQFADGVEAAARV